MNEKDTGARGTIDPLEPTVPSASEDRVERFMIEAARRGLISDGNQQVRTLSVWQFLADLFSLPRH